VGRKDHDDGLVLFLFMKERKVRIEVGIGLEQTISDDFAASVIRDRIVPTFRKEDYAGGLNAAADALIARIDEEAAHEK
jgi:uncharacterized protein